MNVENCCEKGTNTTEIPPKCEDILKELRRYLIDSREFISKCNTCPVARKLVVNADKIIEKLK
jgi:hypothetical protein